jgi:hypothetical protein
MTVLLNEYPYEHCLIISYFLCGSNGFYTYDTKSLKSEIPSITCNHENVIICGSILAKEIN